MKRGKKTNKKPVPVEDAADGSDSDEPPQLAMKGKGKRKAVNIAKQGESNSEEAPPQPTKKGKSKGKAVNTAKEDELDSDEAPPQPTKKGKAKGKAVNTAKEDKLDSDEAPPQPTKKGKVTRIAVNTAKQEESDSDEAPPQATKKRKAKGKTVNTAKQDESNSDEAPPQATKKRKAKRTTVNTAEQDESDSDEAPPQATKKGKAKGKAVNTGKKDESDSDEAPPQATKKGKAKGKAVNTGKQDESDSEEATPQPTKKKRKAKGKTVNTAKQKESDSEESPQPTKKGKAKGKAANIVKQQESVITKQVSKMTAVKGKDAIVKQEPAEDSSDNSDVDEPKPPKSIKKERPKRMPIIKKEKCSESSDSEEKPTQAKKKLKGKKVTKTPRPVEVSSDDSDSEAKPIQVKKRIRVKKEQIKNEIKNEDKSDSDDKPSTSTESTSNASARKEEEKTDQAENESSESSAFTASEEAQIPIDVDNLPDVIELSSEESDLETDYIITKQKHRDDLEHLRRIDTDFYKYLKENASGLLRFDEDENALDEKDDDDKYDVVKDNDDKLHKPGELHGDSDESDFEEDSKPIIGKVTLKMVVQWDSELQKDGKMKLSTFTHVLKLFNAAVMRATSEDGATEGEYQVAGASVFNAILNMCVLTLPNAIKKYLGIGKSWKDPRKCKHFVKIKGILVQYLTDVLKLLLAVTSDNIVIILLKHLHQMSGYIACFTRIAKRSIKRLLTLWSTGDDTVRVLAFMCILRITRNQQTVLLQLVLKAMFMTYVKNCKFVSPTTWPGIHFMRRSLVEMYSLDLDVSYPLVFLYMRQLGIHLRNAIVVPSLDHRLAVYNWQYLNCIRLWIEVIQYNMRHKDINSLSYPMSMIISMVVSVVPTPQYYPVRFYCLELILKMSREARFFIPVLPHLLEVLSDFDFNKKTTSSMKPLDFSCMIRVGKSQMNETAFKDAVLDKFYELLLDYTSSISHCISFADICVVLIMQLKEVLKKLTVANYAKRLQQLLDKIEESAKFIRNARRYYKKSILNCDHILAWEEQIRLAGTPLLAFFENFKKVNKIQKRKNETKNDELAGVMPLIKRPKISEASKELVKIERDRDGPVTLFPSDSEDDDINKHFKIEVVNKTRPKMIVEEPQPKQKKMKQTIKDINIYSPDTEDEADEVDEFVTYQW